MSYSSDVTTGWVFIATMNIEYIHLKAASISTLWTTIKQAWCSTQWGKQINLISRVIIPQLGFEPCTLGTMGKHTTNWATPLPFAQSI